ncbi:hypothetical protein [Vibrio furnissii]|uniref:hypothetical protein n=1 Tax=Vibrio furnissii TaxID=29494 RepID=UPI001EECDC4D|nr:hypothetical protein [Vibrio furnissii]MCG6268624.1 hypothetical protein [Vibrio furnissii]
MNKLKLDDFLNSVRQADTQELMIDVIRVFSIHQKIPHSDAFELAKEEILTNIDIEPEEFNLDEIAEELRLKLEQKGNNLKVIDDLARQVQMNLSSKAKFSFNDISNALNKHDFENYEKLSFEGWKEKIDNAENMAEKVLLADAFAFNTLKAESGISLPQPSEIKEFLDNNYELFQFGDDKEQFDNDFAYYIQKSENFKNIYNISDLEFALAMQQDTVDTILENLEHNGMSDELTAKNLYGMNYLTDDYSVDTMVELTDAEFKAHYLTLSNEERDKFKELVKNDDAFKDRFDDDVVGYLENLDAAYITYINEYNPEIDKPVYENGVVIGGMNIVNQSKKTNKIDNDEAEINELENQQNKIYRQNHMSLLSILKESLKSHKNDLLDSFKENAAIKAERKQLLDDVYNQYKEEGYKFGALKVSDKNGKTIGMKTPTSSSCPPNTNPKDVAVMIASHLRSNPNKHTVFKLNCNASANALATEYLPQMVRDGLIDFENVYIIPKEMRKAFKNAMTQGVGIETTNKIDKDEQNLTGPDNVEEPTDKEKVEEPTNKNEVDEPTDKNEVEEPRNKQDSDQANESNESDPKGESNEEDKPEEPKNDGVENKLDTDQFDEDLNLLDDEQPESNKNGEAELGKEELDEAEKKKLEESLNHIDMNIDFDDPETEETALNLSNNASDIKKMLESKSNDLYNNTQNRKNSKVNKNSIK